MSIPESKIMLAIYLATPEVDNDRRALNVINGMRRAKKEGRFMGVAPKDMQTGLQMMDGNTLPCMNQKLK